MKRKLRVNHKNPTPSNTTTGDRCCVEPEPPHESSSPERSVITSPPLRRSFRHVKPTRKLVEEGNSSNLVS
ncbi:unnamed protein product [Arabidopsis thaliana]|uniref:(thale cress) hypothetical protein n=1 Tax=Arabidopsis thaliana TaxID=3702 RepID=A0A7G2FI82_ARATH|nr:unnamed protein product [Arabidopsis thaliana]